MGKKAKVKSVVAKDGVTLEPLLLRFQHATTKAEASSEEMNKIFGSAVFSSRQDESNVKDYAHLSANAAFESRFRTNEEGRKAAGRGTKRHLVALQSDAMTYIGTGGGEEELVKTYVALQSGKKLRVFEVTPVTVAPFIKGHSHVVEKERDTNIQKSREERKSAAVDLVKAFGSKKKRLTYERTEKNKIDVTDMNESMNKASVGSANAVLNAEEPIMKDESVLTLVPPCNREAKDPNGVYNVDDIISPEELDDLHDVAQQFLNVPEAEMEQWRQEKKYSDFFFAMWRKLSSRKNDARAIRNAKLTIYTELLIIILKMRFEQLRKKVLDIPDVFPSWLVDKALSIFTNTTAKGLRVRPDALKDKTCCYVMVIYLLINDFVFDVQLMSTSVNIHIRKLLTLAKAVGITVVLNAATKEYRGSLRLPLPKPIEKRGRQRALR